MSAHGTLANSAHSGVLAATALVGAALEDQHQQKLGTIHDLLFDEVSGQLVFAILNFGGHFVGVDQRYYPLPWRLLRRQTQGDGYCIDIDRQLLDAAPRCEHTEAGQWVGHSPAAPINAYYGIE